jgi:hypothetical protein
VIPARDFESFSRRPFPGRQTADSDGAGRELSEVAILRSAGGRAKGKIGFHEGTVEIERLRVRGLWGREGPAELGERRQRRPARQTGDEPRCRSMSWRGVSGVRSDRRGTFRRPDGVAFRRGARSNHQGCANFNAQRPLSEDAGTCPRYSL